MSLDIEFVDFHCHIDLYKSPEKIIKEAEKAKVFTIGVTTIPRAWPQNRKWTKNCKYIKSALGFHPELIKQKKEEIALFENYINQTNFLGEIGLDKSPPLSESYELQKDIFNRILVQSNNKILSVHSRRAAKDVIEILAKHQKQNIAVLHWFSGSTSQASKALDIGCYFSINPQMLYSERGKELIKYIPLSRMLTETDGPFVKINNKIAEPQDVSSIVDRIACIKLKSLEDIKKSIISNVNEILKVS